MEKKNEYKRIAKNILRGQELLGDSVVYQNKSVLDDAFELLESQKNIYLTGIKDTGQIDYTLVRELIEDSKFVFHTLDKMSRELTKLFRRPQLFNNYFNQHYQKRRDGFIKGGN